MKYDLVLSFSGGLDSVVLLHELIKAKKKLRAIYLDFGKLPAQRELSSAKYHSLQLGVPLDVVPMQGVTHMAQGFASLAEMMTDELDVGGSTGFETRDGFLTRGCRNDAARVSGFLVVAGVTAYYAQLLGVEHVAFAVTKEQTKAVPGVLKSLDSFSKAVEILNTKAGSFSLETPFQNLTKAEIIKKGAKLKVPFDSTWSCLLGGIMHCGKCVQCLERQSAFKAAKINDSTVYEES